jgi:hypothetical protein
MRRMMSTVDWRSSPDPFVGATNGPGSFAGATADGVCHVIQASPFVMALSTHRRWPVPSCIAHNHDGDSSGIFRLLI